MEKFVNNIICGDCIELLGSAEGKFADLVFADPPFNIGYQYDKYHDRKKRDKYLSWTRDWIAACIGVLKDSGSFYIAIGDEYAADIKLICDGLGLFLRNWLIWHYTFGQQTKNKFARSHAHIFYYVMDKDNFKFNDAAVRVPSDRQLIYNDKRANPRGKMPDDVWEDSRVCGTFYERQGWHPCQMPESVLARIIAASSSEGDLVLDPFSGSGTTAAAAKRLGRKWCGIDISDNYVENTKRRLEDIRADDEAVSEYEVTRLCTDMRMEGTKILQDKMIMDIFETQLANRLNGQMISESKMRDILSEIRY